MKCILSHLSLHGNMFQLHFEIHVRNATNAHVFHFPSALGHRSVACLFETAVGLLNTLLNEGNKQRQLEASRHAGPLCFFLSHTPE